MMLRTTATLTRLAWLQPTTPDSDNNSRTAAIPYEKTSKGGKVPDAAGGTVKGFKPQKVNNVMGSVAGSGSGDFHHYRAGRRREMLRLKKMDADWEASKLDEAFDREQAQKKKLCEDRTRKRTWWWGTGTGGWWALVVR